MDIDSIESLISELNTKDLFEENKIFVVREIHKINSKQKDFLKYLEFLDPNNILILIHNKYNVVTKFLKEIKNVSIVVNTSPPFKNKIIDWVKYIIKLKKYNINNRDLNKIIEIYGNSISSILNEVEKIDLLNQKDIHNKIVKYNITEKINREYFIWNLLDSLGSKKLDETLIVYESLTNHGYTSIQLLIQLVNFYKFILINKNDNSNLFNPSNFNKILIKKNKYYMLKYNNIEIENILIKLRSLDIKLKTTTTKEKMLFYPLLTSICKDIYA